MPALSTLRVVGGLSLVCGLVAGPAGATSQKETVIPFVHRVYPGPELPESQVATLQYRCASIKMTGPGWPSSMMAERRLASIDGRNVPCECNSHVTTKGATAGSSWAENEYRMLPGRHVLRFAETPDALETAEFDAVGGKTYRVTFGWDDVIHVRDAEDGRPRMRFNVLHPTVRDTQTKQLVSAPVQGVFVPSMDAKKTLLLYEGVVPPDQTALVWLQLSGLLRRTGLIVTELSGRTSSGSVRYIPLWEGDQAIAKVIKNTVRADRFCLLPGSYVVTLRYRTSQAWSLESVAVVLEAQANHQYRIDFSTGELRDRGFVLVGTWKATVVDVTPTKR